MKKTSLVKGTIILTLACIITRILGFFYRILLSKELGTELLGVYQLVFPIYGICFTLYAAGLQIAIAQIVAMQDSKENQCKQQKTLLYGMILSLIISLIITVLLQTQSMNIATLFFQEPRLASLLRILSLVFPFCGITSCINGYFIGKQQVKIPAVSQIIEQLGRILIVLSLGVLLGGNSFTITCEITVIGIIAGELISNLYNLIQYKKQYKRPCSNNIPIKKASLFKRLLVLSVPMSGTRFLTALLHSIEAILIPFMLRAFGMSSAMSLSTYGIVTGMVMPFILFPGSLTTSMSTMLLPKIASDSGIEQKNSIKHTVETGLKYSILIGIFSWTIFLSFGRELGELIYHSTQAGQYLIFLSALCPLLYVSTTTAGILNGLGKTYLTFITTTTGLTIRILFLIFLTPEYGIYAYFFGLLVGQLVNTCVDLLLLRKYIYFQMNLFGLFVVPLFFMFGLIFVLNKIEPYVNAYPVYIVLPVEMFIVFAIFIGFGIKTKLISMNS